MTDQVFVGRNDEVARFAVLLGELPLSRRSWLPKRSRARTLDEGIDRKSRVVLVHGLGGSGKSRLLRQFQALADGGLPGSPVLPGQVRTAFVDWEDEQRKRPALYADADGPTLVTVLDAVRQAVMDACGADAKASALAGVAFADYRDGVARMRQYAARFADVIAQSAQPGSQFTSDDAAVLGRSLASAGLTLAGHPAGLLGLSADQIGASAQAVGRLSAAAVRAVTGRKASEILDTEYDLMTDPARELTRRAAAALRCVTSTVPMILFLDTGEVIGSTAWRWLRRVMTQTGTRIVWVAGARFETEAEAGVSSPVAVFVREVGNAHLALMSPTQFDDLMISQYLASRVPGRSYSRDQVDLIARFTRGLPLAVSLTGELLERGAAVEAVCAEVTDGLPGSVVSALARRFLVHAEQQSYQAGDPRKDDVEKILGLALAYGDLRTDPEMLAALWDVTDPLTVFQDLAQRHDFVLPVSRRLHDDVRDILRADLLDPYRRARVRGTCQRARALYLARLTEMRLRWPTLDEQLGHQTFTTAVLGLMWHTLWWDTQAGLDLLAEIEPVLALTDLATARACGTMAWEFAETFNGDQRTDLERITFHDSGECYVRVPPGEDVLVAASSTAAEPAIGTLADLHVAMQIARAMRSERHWDYEEASSSLLAAARQTTSSRLRRAIASEAGSMLSRSRHPSRAFSPSAAPARAAAATVFAEMHPDDPGVWQTLAAAQRAAGRFDDALAANDKLLDLEPDDAVAHYDKGHTLTCLDKYAEALGAYDMATQLEPGWGSAHTQKGIILAVLGHQDLALAALDEASDLGGDSQREADVWAAAILWHRGDIAAARHRLDGVPGHVTARTSFRAAELDAIARCATDQVDIAEGNLRKALSWRDLSDSGEITVLYDLFSDPALPGIERLRAIANNAI